MNWTTLCLLAWLATFLLAALCTWACRYLALRWGFVDEPKHEAHKNHARRTPVMGGLGMLTAWLGVIGAGLFASRLNHPLLTARISEYIPGISTVLRQLLTVIAGAIALTAWGMWDDRKAMHALPKFGGQFVVAAVTAWLGMRTSCFWAVPGMNWLVTTLWIMTVINALNFFDNMDGLAGGTAAIAAFFLLVIALCRGQYFVSMLSAVTCGAACGFLWHNAPPAKIFMGDGGSHFLGYVISVTCVLTTFYVPSEAPTPTPVLIPFLILLVPLFDAVTVVILRLREGKPFYVGDNRHISHRFTQIGLSRPYAVLLVCLLCFICGGAAVLLLWLPPVGAGLVFAQLAAALAIISIIQFKAPNRTTPPAQTPKGNSNAAQ